MTDLSAALRDAILGALPIDWEDRTTVVEVVPNEKRGFGANVVWGHPERLADAILAAVQAVLDEGATVEWALRYPDGSIPMPALFDEAVARHIAATTTIAQLTVVSRRVTEWEER